MTTKRRDLLRNLAGLGLCGSLGDWTPLAKLSSTVVAQTPDAVDGIGLEPDIEPLVRKIEETPREKCFEMITAELAGGLTYRRFLAALFLAGVRNVNPQPPGFDLHCVFVIQAAHQMSLDALPGERLLPLYWALDEFKKAQASDAKKNGDWRMMKLDGEPTSPDRAWRELAAAMDDWDGPRAERAVAGLLRFASGGEIIETLWKYGARDFRNIGHKAIYVANASRTLEVIGWRHAEPVLRSLVTALVDFGPDQKVNEYAFEDQVYRANFRRVEREFSRLDGAWSGGVADDGATRGTLEMLREADPETACKQAFDDLAKGKTNAAAVWDAVHLTAGEQMMRQPGIVGLHAVTSTSALHYAFQTTGWYANRPLLLLQAVGWLCQFHRAELARNEGRFDVDITKLEPTDLPASTDAAAAIFSADTKPNAARLALTYGRRGHDFEAFAAAARTMIFSKVTEPHGYKYPAAVFEDYQRVSPQWRPHLLATGVYHLPNAKTPDAPLMKQARDAVRSLSKT